MRIRRQKLRLMQPPRLCPLHVRASPRSRAAGSRAGRSIVPCIHGRLRRASPGARNHLRLCRHMLVDLLSSRTAVRRACRRFCSGRFDARSHR